MARIKGKNTGPELAVRSALFKAGFRFRIHNACLAGSPDLVLPRYGYAVFVHGCFWHGHHCRRGRKPSSNVDFWAKKLSGNIARDKRNTKALHKLGWQVRIIWTCDLEPATRKLIEELEAQKMRAIAEVRSN